MNYNTNRTESAIKNTIFGVFNKFITILLLFITRTVIIYFIGIEYAGLNSLFSSILQVLNLAELGISSAVVFCMYKPMAENDTETLCSLLYFIKRIYYIIGCIVLIVGITIIPFLSILVKGEIPNGLNMGILYIIYLINTVVGYFFFAYKSTLLYAGQKVGFLSNINSIILLIQNILQIVGLIVTKNYYMYLILMPIFTVLNNILVAVIVKKEYPDIVCKGKLKSENKKIIIMKIKGLFISKICVTSRNAFDSIFISSYIGLTTLAIYGNYMYIMYAILGILGVITTAITAGVGNSIVTESVHKNYNDLRKFNFIFNWISGFCTCCIFTMIQPFMILWMGNNSLFPLSMVILICTYFYFLNIGSIRAVYHDAAGLWWEARFRAVFEAVLNLILNFMLTKSFGVFGTILGTLISLILVNYCYGTQIVFKYYFKGINPKQYFLDNFLYGITTLVGCIVTYYIINLFHVGNVVKLIMALGASIFVFNTIYFICFFKTSIFKESLYIFKRISLHKSMNNKK